MYIFDIMENISLVVHFPCIFEGAGGVKPTKYMLRPAYTGEVLSELIKELIDLAFSYVYEFEELKEG